MNVGLEIVRAIENHMEKLDKEHFFEFNGNQNIFECLSEEELHEVYGEYYQERCEAEEEYSEWGIFLCLLDQKGEWK